MLRPRVEQGLQKDCHWRCFSEFSCGGIGQRPPGSTVLGKSEHEKIFIRSELQVSSIAVEEPGLELAGTAREAAGSRKRQMSIGMRTQMSVALLRAD